MGVKVISQTCNQSKAFVCFFRCSVCSRSTERLISDSGSLCSSHYSQYSGDSDGNKRHTRVLGFVYFSPFNGKCACQSSSSVFSHLKHLQPFRFTLKCFRAIPTPRLGVAATQICSFANQSSLLPENHCNANQTSVCMQSKENTDIQTKCCLSLQVNG